MITFEVPNLDVEPPCDLEILAGVFQMLHCYAKNKADATRDRWTGDVQHALELEAQCDAIYKNLPDWAKW
jgi:hypothetical protein